jgi:hypothetical protein
LLGRSLARRCDDFRCCKRLADLVDSSTWPANISRRALSSAQLKSPYSSNFRAVGGPQIGGSEHDAWFPQYFGRPPTSTVAVKVCPANPDVSRVIVAVPWPPVIFPADTDQLKVSLADGSPPDRLAEKIGVEPMPESGHETVTVGQLCE